MVGSGRRTRLRIELQGAVQGVGFRPFVYRLARDHELAGWVINDSRGVLLEVEGDEQALRVFSGRLEQEKPAPSMIDRREESWIPPIGDTEFVIRGSDRTGPKTVQMLPDIATCTACRNEVLDPANRRHGYPFTNCTRCGPRLSIILSLPYDRPRTSMRRFEMCPACSREYCDPADRRFHAQPNACPHCGPRLELWSREGETVASNEAALAAAAAQLARGGIVAVKSLGGFHLRLDARNGEAVRRLRNAKPRRDKPLAVMVRDLEQARALCRVDPGAAAILESPAAPIVLLPRLDGALVHEAVAPGNPNLGVMLPSTPLDHLLMRPLDFPVVATSGNRSDEPICTDEQEALRRLEGVCDRFLVHDRPIVRHVDDSVVRIFAGAPTILRRARGYAPRPVVLDTELPTVLAVGAHLKNAVALSVGRQVFVSQHIGDMETPEAIRAFERVIEDFLGVYEARPVAIVHDLHPDYVTTGWARDATNEDRSPSHALAGLPAIAVQHHHAHLASCLAENRHDGTALGVTWDGAGFGTDGTIWGGEFLVGNASSFRRVASLRPFRLPGGDAAAREPRRSALALLWELEGEAAIGREELHPLRSFSNRERELLARMLASNVNTPVSTSAGRLFDAVAALTGLHQETSFEGQAAMALEMAADPAVTDGYPLSLHDEGEPPLVVDWRETLAAVLEEIRGDAPVGRIAARFHNTLIEAIVRIAEAIGEHTVALTGGCFQNAWLVERAVQRLSASGFQVLLHRQVPPNDGGISLGQVTVAAAALGEATVESPR